MNTWKVQWEEDASRFYKRFQGDSPSAAVEFAKRLKSRGLSVAIISAHRAFGIPKCKKHFSIRKGCPSCDKRSGGPGQLWCPYCVAWRDFHFASIKSSDFITPNLYRCTTCTISIKDYFVRKYNPVEIEKLEIIAAAKETRKVRNNNVQNTKRSVKRRR